MHMFCLYILLGAGQVRTERDVGMSLIGNQYSSVARTNKNTLFKQLVSDLHRTVLSLIIQKQFMLVSVL